MSAVSNDRRVEFYTMMVRIMLWEQRLLQMIQEGQVSGYYHPGRGQEGAQVGAIAALRGDDYLLYGHRGMGYQIARGVPLEAIYSDFLGNADGPTAGLGAGTIHIASAEHGLLGQAGGVGGTFALAVGAALSSRQAGTDRVAMCMFGEGTANRGTFHEAANAASIWKLGVVWLCENNGWAISSSFEEMSSVKSIADRASAYGMPGVRVDGQDAAAVFGAVDEAVRRARAGEGPTLIEAVTLRFRGHYEGDAQTYRAGEDVESYRRDRDPIRLVADSLLADGVVSAARLDEIRAREAERVEAAARKALAGSPPPFERVFEGVYAGEDVA